MSNEKIKKAVRKGYAEIAKRDSSCCIPTSPCCGSSDLAEDIDRKIGYAKEELNAVPKGANLGLGCGNPTALASLKEGEIVLDLGSGAGFDCFLAANKVGKTGRVIGVDMTPEMIDKARENATKGNYENVEFMLGEIENLPAGDNSVDVLISNCVINLSPNKKRVFMEAFRVLKPQGRLMISDIVLLKELPDSIKNSVSAYIACVSGAIMKNDYMDLIKKAGFQRVNIMDESPFHIELMVNDTAAKRPIEALNPSSENGEGILNSIASIKVSGIKPG